MLAEASIRYKFTLFVASALAKELVPDAAIVPNLEVARRASGNSDRAEADIRKPLANRSPYSTVRWKSKREKCSRTSVVIHIERDRLRCRVLEEDIASELRICPSQVQPVRVHRLASLCERQSLDGRLIEIDSLLHVARDLESRLVEVESEIA